jgi:penicillin-binding protein 1A
MLGRALKWLAVATVWAGLAGLGVVAWYAYDLPNVSHLGERQRAPSIRLIAADGSMIARFGDLYGPPASIEELPSHLIHAVLATEDRRFMRHFGLDPLALARAGIANLRAGRIVQGGSTITQQLAKNVFLTPARTLKRKVQELLLALWLERKFTKDEILTIYLNRVYLGAGAYGVEAAAQRYFAKSARNVTLSEAAMLAGLLRAPSRYAPSNDLGRAQARAAQVLAGMVAAGYLTPANAEEAQMKPAKVASTRRAGRGSRYFADWVLDQVSGFAGPGASDIVVRTTLDVPLQRAAEAAVEWGLSGAGGPSRIGQAALIALAPDGAVRAMVGGRDYNASQFNRATQALRQPGSAFKLFVYLAALEAGYSPQDIVEDAPLTIRGWSPRNYDGRYVGPVTLRDALATSRNTVAVRVAEQVGPEGIIGVARRLGITSELGRDASLALGTSEVTLIELTAAYATLANQGHGVWPHGIVEIRAAESGAVLYRRGGSGPGQVVAQHPLRQMTEMLRAVVTNGTGRAAKLPVLAAGKTGTSQGFRDAWFVGFTHDLVAGVWHGNDDHTPMEGATGGGLPARLWARFMKAALASTAALPPESGVGESALTR